MLCLSVFSLTKRVFRGDLEKIGAWAFRCCRNLTDIIAPCCDIEEDAFALSGLENFSFAENTAINFDDFDGTSLSGTPLQNKYSIILFPKSNGNSFSCFDYHVALVGNLAKLKFPQGTTVYMGKNPLKAAVPSIFRNVKGWKQTIILFIIKLMNTELSNRFPCAIS